MTAMVHPRETGTTLRCDYGRDVDDDRTVFCECRFTVGIVGIRRTRVAACAAGWTRGTRHHGSGNARSGTGRPANGWMDICPACTPLERAELAAREVDAARRREERGAHRRARWDALERAAAATERRRDLWEQIVAAVDLPIVPIVGDPVEYACTLARPALRDDEPDGYDERSPSDP